MTLTDDDLRALVAARVALAPEPPAPDELRARWEQPHSAIRTQHPRGRVLAAAAALVLVVAAVISIGSRGRDPVPGDDGTVIPAGPTVGRYFVPASLPDGYRLLSFIERAGSPDMVVPAQSLWRQASTGWLVHLEVGVSTGGNHANSVSLDGGGTATWDEPPSELPPDMVGQIPISFTVRRDDSIVWGTTDARTGGPTLRALFEAVRVVDGVPTLASDEYELVSSRPTSTAPIASTWTAIYGLPGSYLGTGYLRVTALRSALPFDVPLELRVATETVERGGRTLHAEFTRGRYRWFAASDLSIAVEGHGDLAEVLGSLVEIDPSTLVAEVIPSIEPGADGLDVADRIEFSNGAVAEFLGTRDSPRGVCVEVDGARRCDLGIMLNAGYTYEDTIRQADVDLLLDGRWFTVGVRVAGAVVESPVPDGAEVVNEDDRIYYLIERPADAATVSPGDLWSTVRPSR